MRLTLRGNLPFTTLIITHQERIVEVSNILIDTGSGATILGADIVKTVQITPSPTDPLYIIRGVGRSEVVFSRRVDSLKIGDCKIDNFEIQIGGMDYGFEINGILEMDFLLQAGAIINLRDMEIVFSR